MVGAGWDAAEHEAYGIPFPGIGERFDRDPAEITMTVFVLFPG